MLLNNEDPNGVLEAEKEHGNSNSKRVSINAKFKVMNTLKRKKILYLLIFIF